jgi:UDPglucose--hexose-1-phosphate uridylyltransferase
MIELMFGPHRRLNPLTREWVLVSPQRTNRPWQGQTEAVAATDLPEYDPSCYLCPGNTRAGGHQNPAYTGVFAFDNDFPALLPQPSLGMSADGDGLLLGESEAGLCRVLCFSPHHGMTLSRMSVEQIRPVVDAWAEQFHEMMALPFIKYVQIFENRGEMMGCSNPHPHCQIWASESVPSEIRREESGMLEHSQTRNGSCLLCDYLKAEREERSRIVYANEYFTVVVPFWAVWPFETLMLPNRHVGAIDWLGDRERTGMADAIRNIGMRYDKLFGAPFPYSMGLHQQPKTDKVGDGWHLHTHYYPPLLRSATVRKFMVGYEMLASPQRDTTPESAAEMLREVGKTGMQVV